MTTDDFTTYSPDTCILDHIIDQNSSTTAVKWKNASVSDRISGSPNTLLARRCPRNIMRRYGHQLLMVISIVGETASNERACCIYHPQWVLLHVGPKHSCG